MSETPRGVTNPRREILNVVRSLERFGQYDFRSDGYIKIQRWPTNRALSSYRTTLLNIPGKLEGEPPSASMVEEAQIEWAAEKADIGYKIRQTHIGTVHPEMRPIVDKWVEVGKPYPSSGGFYYTIPNKSYERVKGLQEYPEYRDAVRRLGIEEEWLAFWERYIPFRYQVSEQLLGSVINKTDIEALSRGNERAGTGLQIRGRRLSRGDLAEVAGDLTFLLKYMTAMSIAFAAVQLAELPPDSVFVIDVYDPRIKGAIASRSDMEVQDVNWDGERLTITGTTQTRQAGSDASGVLSNSHSERKILGSSVTEKVLKDGRRTGVEYPFTDRELLIKIWSLDAKPFPGKEYVIGEDFGMLEPVKSPADALFSRGFLRLAGSKVVPLMLSGSSFTQAVYSVFHNHFITKGNPADQMLALGDDMNYVTMSTTDEIFAPYQKVKSTDPTKNTKKILGWYTVMDQKEDPRGESETVGGVVPRVFKTISSATKQSSAWGETLSNLSLDGRLTLKQPDETMNAIKADMEILLPYQQVVVPRKEFHEKMRSVWSHISPEHWKVLVRYNEELQYRLMQEEMYDSEP